MGRQHRDELEGSKHSRSGSKSRKSKDDAAVQQTSETRGYAPLGAMGEGEVFVRNSGARSTTERGQAGFARHAVVQAGRSVQEKAARGQLYELKKVGSWTKDLDADMKIRLSEAAELREEADGRRIKKEFFAEGGRGRAASCRVDRTGT